MSQKHMIPKAPEDALVPPQASGSIQESPSKIISLVNCSNVRLQESMDMDWKPYGRADTFMYHLTQHIAFTPQRLRELSSHLMSRKASCHENSWWISESSSSSQVQRCWQGLQLEAP